jgi:hypothetical protein
MFGRFVPKGWPLTFIACRLACEASQAKENDKNAALCSFRAEGGIRQRLLKFLAISSLEIPFYTFNVFI